MNWWTAPPLSIVLAGLAGIVAWHLIPRRHSGARLVVQIAFFLVMSAFLLDGAVIPYEPARGDANAPAAILIAAAKLLWWMHLAWALIGFVRLYLVFERRPREARLLQDVVVGIVHLGTLLSILAFVFAVPVGTLIATSGVFAIILGLALQNTVSDVFSGIALNLGRPYVLGDWITLGDGTEGRVVETSWRSTQLLTAGHNVAVLPNGVLAKLGLTNVSRPDESHALSFTVRLAPTATPATIVGVMHQVLLASDSILKGPPPQVAIRSMDAAAIELDLSFRVANLDRRITARNEIADLVYRHCRAAGLALALPPSTPVAMPRPPDERNLAAAPFTALELIRSIPIFSALTEDEQQALAASATVRGYRKDEVIVRQGEMIPSLMIIRTGVVVRQIGDDAAGPSDVGHLSPGDFFGETGLLAGIGETATLRAISHVAVYEIDQQSFAPLLIDRPELADDLAAILSARMSAVDDAATGQPPVSSKSALLKAIEKAFRAAPLGRVLSIHAPSGERRRP